jgi:hypothetical protein
MLTGPAMVNHDISLLKTFKLRERLKLQVRLETFNTLNDVNFSAPNGSLASGSFGKITSANAGRVAQVAAKVLW